MTATAGAAPRDAPRRLVVVGATAGMGRWLVEQLLWRRAWDSVVLVDSVELDLASVGSLQATDAVVAALAPHGDRGLVAYADSTHESTERRPLPIDTADTAVVLAVPREAIGEVVDWLAPLLAPDATICAVSATQTTALGVVAERWPREQVFGLHPLFDPSVRSAEGQTFLIVGEAERDRTGAWLTELIAAAGGISDSGSAADHDAIMGYVQTMTHQALISFADAVTASGLDLEHVWEARTPLFEGLFGLAVRALAERQQATIAEIQVSTGGEQAADEFAAAAARLRAAVVHDLDVPHPEAIEALIAATRDRFSGGLFETIQATAVSAVTAAQSKRSELARHRHVGSLVGVRPIARPDTLRVGRITEVTPVAVTLREVMVGKRGAATFIDGPGHRNAARLGVNGTATSTVFGLGHIDVVVGDDLDRALSDWLAFIKRDVRFLVPESVAGKGVLTIVANHPGIRDAEVVAEVVRTGQRSVVVRVWIRADHDVEDMVEELRARVQDTYRWPGGLSRSTDATHVHYLGPPGTFSEAAALQAREHLGPEWIITEPCDGFAAVLAAIGDRSRGDRSIGVLPISSSASGLVTRSVSALLDHPGALVAGGVVDVAVRIDAYVQEDRQLADLRGARVLSHPQALGQCDGFIRRWGLVPVPCPSTAEALVIAARDPEPCVALAAAGFDTPAGLKVAEREVDDLSGSITRFLILGDGDAFGDIGGGWDPTLRSLWVADSVASILPMVTAGEPAFDELLTDADGRCLWVTSRQPDEESVPGPALGGVRYLGRAPWSPRTPVVRVEVDVPRDRA